MSHVFFSKKQGIQTQFLFLKPHPGHINTSMNSYFSQTVQNISKTYYNYSHSESKVKSGSDSESESESDIASDSESDIAVG